MEELNYIDTTEGTPQGGIISPVLCNIALNGLESKMKETFPLKKGISSGIHLIRYADDMIITGKSEEILYKAKNVVIKFLIERGLQLNEEKTRIVNIKEGFDFLGFNLKRMKKNPTFNELNDQTTVLVIKPSKKGITKFKDNIRRIIKRNRPFISIIKRVNPIIRG